MAVVFGRLIFLHSSAAAETLPRADRVTIEAAILPLDNNSIELDALIRIFRIQGIPYQLINASAQAWDSPVIYTSGTLAPGPESNELGEKLYNFVEAGGVLVYAGHLPAKLKSLFSVTAHFPSTRRTRMNWTKNELELRYVNHPNEMTISLGNGEDDFYEDVIWSQGYQTEGRAENLANFSDNTAGLVKNRYGRGTAYLLGLSYTESVLFPHIGKDFEAQRQYVNSFEPSADVIMLFLKGIYETYYKPYVYLSVSPHAKRTSLILSHDVDAQTSFVDSLKYADLEEEFGVTSTFFENTKYFTDWMDIDYYNREENKEAIRELKRRGWDIGSHTVSHYKQFSQAPLGSPDVTFATYRPETEKTIYGELIVSKELLDKDISGQNTVSFRAGDLEYPLNLLGILEKTGYLYDSTFSANDVLSNFPYFGYRERNSNSGESKVIEIPVTLDDALGFLAPGNQDAAVEIWKEAFTNAMHNEGITTLLVHPSNTRTETFKLEAQRQLMEYAVINDAWVGNLTEFGEFWRQRDSVEWHMEKTADGKLILVVDSPEISSMIGFIAGNTRGVPVELYGPERELLATNQKTHEGKLYIARD